MIIKKWNATDNEWTPLSPQVTYTDIVDSVTETTPEPIFDGGKLRATYLPDFVFGGMRFQDSLPTSNLGYSTFTSRLHTTWLAHGQDSLNGMIGKYYIAEGDITVQVPNPSTQVQTEGSGTTSDPTRYWLYDSINHELEEDEDPGDFNIEHGDWLVITGVSGAGTSTSDPYVVEFAVINNTYQKASYYVSGITKLGSNTTQTVSANSVSAIASRTYAIQNNSDNRLVVNVPWTDNTFRGVVVGSSTMNGSDTLSLQAGTNVSINEGTSSGGSQVFTFNSTDTQREIKLGGTQKIASTATTALDFVAGDNMTISENNGAFTFDSEHPTISAHGGLTASSRTYVTSLTLDSFGHITGIGTGTETVTDTTYTAGNGIALNGSNQFSVTGGIGLTTEASGLKMTYPIYHGDTLPDLSSITGVDNVIGFEW
jgi:hypothetical protein